jgi:hypothetical protein
MSCRVCLLTLTATLAATPAFAGPLAPPPRMPHRVATADFVVVGTVVRIEEKPALALPYPRAKEKVEFQVAVVKIDDVVLGAKGLTHVRVGYFPGQPPWHLGIPPVPFVKDLEVCLFLVPHFDGNFHIPPMYYDILDKKTTPDYDKEVAELKRLVKLLSEPREGLTSKSAADRYTTAGMLIDHYRRLKPGVSGRKEEAIDAELSKLILQTLAEVDWKKPPDGEPAWVYPQSLFLTLGLTEKDGWKPPPGDLAMQKDAAKKWCKENAGTYRIKRFVDDKADKKD